MTMIDGDHGDGGDDDDDDDDGDDGDGDVQKKVDSAEVIMMPISPLNGLVHTITCCAHKPLPG